MPTYAEPASAGAPATATPVLPPASPLVALNAHFGMLLGVPEIEILSSYPRGKARLHNAWLHGHGVVWGYGVRVGKLPGDPSDVTPDQELRVEPGLALAPAGQELYLERAACLDLGAWFARHEDEVRGDPSFSEADGVVSFDAHVTLRPRACLTRPVPAIAQPCSEAAGGTAFSRLSEQVDLRLQAGRPAAPPAPPYHRLRVLFALEAALLPADQDVLDARDAVLALPSEQQPRAYLEAFRRFAALDTVDLSAPPGTLFPAADDAPIVLAVVAGVRLTQQDGVWLLVGDPPPPVVDVTVRPALVATSSIQELLCGPLFVAPPAPAPEPEPAPDAKRRGGAGPRGSGRRGATGRRRARGSRPDTTERS